VITTGINICKLSMLFECQGTKKEQVRFITYSQMVSTQIPYITDMNIETTIMRSL